MFPKVYQNFVFVQVGVLDAGNFKGAAEVENLREHSRARGGPVSSATCAGAVFTPRRTYALGTDVVDEAAKLCDQHRRRDFRRRSSSPGNWCSRTRALSRAGCTTTPSLNCSAVFTRTAGRCSSCRSRCENPPFHRSRRKENQSLKKKRYEANELAPAQFKVGRVTPCAPGQVASEDGAHGVTRPTFSVRWQALTESTILDLRFTSLPRCRCGRKSKIDNNDVLSKL